MMILDYLSNGLLVSSGDAEIGLVKVELSRIRLLALPEY
jgi:hypothetical protein